MRPWKLSETNYAYVKEHPYEVAVLPLGATEPHNLHLPYGTDTIEGDVVGEEICEAAHARGAKVVLLPTIPYGTETNQMAFPLAMNVNPSTLAAVIRDLVESLATARHSQDRAAQQPRRQRSEAGAARAVRQDDGASVSVQLVQGAVRLRARDLRRSRRPRRRDGNVVHPGLSSGAGRPHGRTADLAADDGATAETRFEAVNRGWVSITRPWHLLTTNTGAGNPHAATAEKGRRMMERLVERLAQFLVELSAAQLDERFPY